MAKRAAGSKKKCYFQIRAGGRGNAPGIEILNLDKLATTPGGASISVEPPWINGVVSTAPDAGPWRLPVFPEPPRLLIDRKLGRAPLDFEIYDSFWLVSAAMKALLESLDPEALDFRACETVLPTGEAGPERWLCTVTRAFLGAVDVEASENLIVGRNPGGTAAYSPTGLTKLKLKGEVVDDAHLFHILEISARAVYCDQSVKDACKAAKLTGLHFYGEIELR